MQIVKVNFYLIENMIRRRWRRLRPVRYIYVSVDCLIVVLPVTQVYSGKWNAVVFYNTNLFRFWFHCFKSKLVKYWVIPSDESLLNGFFFLRNYRRFCVIYCLRLSCVRSAERYHFLSKVLIFLLFGQRAATRIQSGPAMVFRCCSKR